MLKLFSLVKNVVKDNLEMSSKLDLVSAQVNSLQSEVMENKNVNAGHDVVPPPPLTADSDTSQATSSRARPQSNHRPRKKTTNYLSQVSQGNIANFTELAPNHEKNKMTMLTQVEAETNLVEVVVGVSDSCKESESISDVTLMNNVINLDQCNDEDFPPLEIGNKEKPWTLVEHKKKLGYATAFGTKESTGQPRVLEERVQKGNLKQSTGHRPYFNRTRPNQNILVGTGDSKSIQGAKKAWYHLGKVKHGTTVEDVTSFLKTTFPNIKFDIEKLDTKGTNSSFKLGVDFSNKDEIINVSVWPKNVTLKRFLFKKGSITTQR